MTNKPKFTMDDFVDDLIAVCTGTGENLYKFLKACEACGLEWNSGYKATKFVPEYYGKNQCISYGYELAYKWERLAHR